MDSSVLPKDEIWFLCVCHHISNTVYIYHYVACALKFIYSIACMHTFLAKGKIVAMTYGVILIYGPK